MPAIGANIIIHRGHGPLLHGNAPQPACGQALPVRTVAPGHNVFYDVVEELIQRPRCGR